MKIHITKHMTKRFPACLVAIALIIAVLPLSGLAAEATTSNNANAQNYTSYAARPVNSYLFANGDNTFTRFEHIYGSGIVVEVFDAGFNCVSTSEIPMELSIFGGFYSGSDYNFIVFGQSNRSEDNSLEVFRVVKYSKTWQRLGSTGLSNCNTTVPFDAGSLRMTEYGNMLYIRSSHEMYKEVDGYNHQSNITFSVSIPDMRITDGFWGVMNTSYGYVSHSFNQFILTSGSTLAAVDHGDAHPRSIVLLVYSTPAGGERFITGGSASPVTLLSIPGSIGANFTGASIGGFEVSASSYLVAGNSVAHNSDYQSNRTRNIFVSVTPVNNPTSSNTQVKWLTHHAENGQAVTSTPHLVSIFSNTFVILWSEGDTVKYVALDRNGNMKTEIKSMEGALSDCKPIVENGNIIWYVTQSSEPVFYTIDLEEFLIPQNISVSGLSEKTYGDAPFSLSVTSDPVSRLSDFIFSSANTSVAEISSSGQITINGCGTTTITVTERGDEDYAPATRTQELTVGKATLTVTPDETSMTYGDALPDWSLSYSGFAYGEDENALAVKPVVLLTCAGLVNAGTYEVFASGGDAGNYEFSYVGGTLNVAAKEITVSGLAVFDKERRNSDTSATIKNFGYELEGREFGDDIDIDFDTLTAEFDSDSQGTGKNVTISGITLIGADKDNYVLHDSSITVKADIKAALTAQEVADAITGVRPLPKDATHIELPTVPEGFSISIKSSDRPVIDIEGNVSAVGSDTDVRLVFTVTNISDETSADTVGITVTIPESTKKDATGTVTLLPVRYATSIGVSPAVNERINAAVETKAIAAEGLSIRIAAVGPAMTLPIGYGVPTAAAIVPFPGVDIGAVTTMAILNDDGTLSPVPTKANADGTLTVIVSGNATLVPLSIAADFSDVAGHWAAQEIARAASLMIIEGVGGGAFSPSATVTNAEAVTMFLRALGVAANRSSPTLVGIDQSKWYATNMNTAAQLGWISPGIEPEVPITRVETAGLIVGAMKSLGMNPEIADVETAPLLAEFNDLGDLTETEREQLAICVKLGIFIGNGDGTLGPRGELTRAGMATLAVRLQGLILS